MSLNISPSQQAELAACMRRDQGPYSLVSNNCSTPVQNSLKNLGIDTGGTVLPVSLGNKLLDMGLVDGTVVYPATRPSDGWSAPWAR